MNKIYDDLNFEMYKALPGCSVSRAKALSSHCPAYVQWLEDHESDTDSQRLGTVLHARWILEDDSTFQKKEDGRTKAGKEQAATCDSTRLIKAADWEHLEGMLSSLERSKTAKMIRDKSTHRELSANFLYEHDAGEALCKMRADGVIDGKMVWDLKSVNDVSDASINRAILNYRYYWQAWFYTTGTDALKLYAPHFGFIFVQSKPPYYVRLITLAPGWYAAAENEMAPLIVEYDRLEREETWPGYPDEFEDVDLPAWKDRQLEYTLEQDAA